MTRVPSLSPGELPCRASGLSPFSSRSLPLRRAADDDPKEIVAKAIKAHGGEEYLAKHQAVQATEKGKINIPGVGEADFSQESAYMLPDKFKHTIEFEAMSLKIRFVAISNGDKVSVDATVNGQAADLGTNLKEAYKTVPVVIRISHLTPLLKDKSYELSLIGEDKVDDKKVVGVRVSKKSQKDVNVYFDKETGLLTKMEYQHHRCLDRQGYQRGADRQGVHEEQGRHHGPEENRHQAGWQSLRGDRDRRDEVPGVA